MVAQPVTMSFGDIGVDETAENAVVLWAVFNALDSVPATPQNQLAFENARLRLQERIAAYGTDTAQIDAGFASYALPGIQTRGDPRWDCC